MSAVETNSLTEVDFFESTAEIALAVADESLIPFVVPLEVPTEAAFVEFWRENSKTVRQTAFGMSRRGRTFIDTDDLMQEAAIKLWSDARKTGLQSDLGLISLMAKRGMIDALRTIPNSRGIIKRTAQIEQLMCEGYTVNEIAASLHDEFPHIPLTCINQEVEAAQNRNSNTPLSLDFSSFATSDDTELALKDRLATIDKEISIDGVHETVEEFLRAVFNSEIATRPPQRGPRKNLEELLEISIRRFAKGEIVANIANDYGVTPEAIIKRTTDSIMPIIREYVEAKGLSEEDLESRFII